MRYRLIAISAACVLTALSAAAWSMEDDAGGKRQGLLERADANHDGKVSYDEFKAAREQHLQEHFKKMDANGDGFIDKTEAQAAREAMREKMKTRMEKRHGMSHGAQEDKPQ
jgi:hypothetical protein